MEITEELERVISSKEKIKIIYRGGSKPGELREIAPISINGEKIRAKCYLSNKIKTFMVNKIQIMNEEGELSRPLTNERLLPNFSSLADAYKYLKEELINLGWHIKYEEESISLYRRFKNGNLLKTPDIMFYFDEFTSDILFDGENFYEDNIRKKVRPWVLSVKRDPSISYGKINNAIPKFIKYSNSLSPNKLK